MSESGPLRLVGCPPVGIVHSGSVWQVIVVLLDCTSGIADVHKGCGFRPLLGCQFYHGRKGYRSPIVDSSCAGVVYGSRRMYPTVG